MGLSRKGKWSLTWESIILPGHSIWINLFSSAPAPLSQVCHFCCCCSKKKLNLCFSYSFWWLNQDSMDLSKSWSAWTGVPVAVTGQSWKWDCMDYPVAAKSFSWRISLHYISRHQPPETPDWRKEWVLGRENGLQDWVSWTGVHTEGPLSLLLGLTALGLHATWVQLDHL